MNPLQIEVVGAGTVGGATGSALSAWGHDVVYKEISAERREQLRVAGASVVAPDDPVDAHLSLVCVPTPFDGTALDMSYVEAAVDRLAQTAPSNRVVAIRSTVLPGTTERLGDEYGFEHVAMVPEFLFAATAIEDARSVERVVVGTRSEVARDRLETAFGHNDPEFVHLRPTEAELLKLASNAYGATKISFANEMWRLAESIPGTNQDRVLEAFRAVSPWVGNQRGLAGGWPYGGLCLPKDTNGFQRWLDTRDLPAPQLDGTIAENDLMVERGTETRTYGRR